MNTTLGNILGSGSDIRNGIQKFFENIMHYGGWFAILYIVFIVILYVRLHYSHQTLQKINTMFSLSIDTLYYEVSLLLYAHHNDIHGFQDNIPLLLQHKTELLQKKDKAYYHEEYKTLIEEIEYIYQLTEPGKEINNKKDIMDQYNIIITLNNTIHTINNTLTLCTLGLYKIIQ